MRSILGQLPEWDVTTIIIYCASIFFAYFFATLYNKVKSSDGHSKVVFLALSFLSVWFVLAFSTCGADYETYKIIYDGSPDPSTWEAARIEKGYIILNLVFKAIGLSFESFHVIWASALLIMVYAAILHYKDEIDVGIAVLAFAGMYCFQSMNLMRIYFAMAFTLLCFKNYLNGKRLRYFFDLIIAFLIHRSVVCLAVPFIFYELFSSEITVWVKALVSVVIVVALYVFRGLLFSIAFFNNMYGLTESAGFGFGVIIYHIPIAILLIFTYRTQLLDTSLFQKYLVMFLSSFVFGTLSYYVSIVGRVFVFFAPVYILFPAFVLNRKEEVNPGSIVIRTGVDPLFVLRLMYILFILFKTFMMTEYFYTDMIMPYTGIFM